MKTPAGPPSLAGICTTETVAIRPSLNRTRTWRTAGGVASSTVSTDPEQLPEGCERAPALRQTPPPLPLAASWTSISTSCLQELREASCPRLGGSRTLCPRMCVPCRSRGRVCRVANRDSFSPSASSIWITALASPWLVRSCSLRLSVNAVGAPDDRPPSGVLVRLQQHFEVASHGLLTAGLPWLRSSFCFRVAARGTRLPPKSSFRRRPRPAGRQGLPGAELPWWTSALMVGSLQAQPVGRGDEGFVGAAEDSLSCGEDRFADLQVDRLFLLFTACPFALGATGQPGL